MIDEYRDKMELLRGAVTTGARGVPGVAVDLYDRIRGPLDPGRVVDTLELAHWQIGGVVAENGAERVHIG